ncbi:glycerophosphodiester phosphodiesterase family protein [Apibacter raozihei]|uniref:glycerophosphodiester phosphodiesterase n=1 Tax=Apibacter raozihei TaxID=2500547 RepID=UPI000FE37948|nr:glycerophosphodiester phosphodiesterase family protein [Apibacter raozihei]
MKNAIVILLFMNINLFYTQTRVIAHRGYWDTAGSAQNSLVSLSKANEIKVYGSEFDVLITSDGIPVVNHDDDIQGHVIENTPYSQLSNLKLPNGEILPTLEQYLILGKSFADLQLILEIKPHKKQENEKRAVREVLALVKKYNLEKQIEFISFSMNICKELKSKNPNSEIYYLGSDVSPKTIKEIGLTGIDYYYKVLLISKPEWLQEAKEMGLKINVWTVNEDNDMHLLIDKKIDFITTDAPVRLKNLLQPSSLIK